MHRISDKDKKLWNYYTSNLKSIKTSVKKIKQNTNSFLNVSKILKPNNQLTLDSKTKKQLNTKKLNINAIVDLHGKTEYQAYDIIKNFIKNSYLRELRSIVIITGKGTNNLGKLKLKTPLWLKSEEISKFIIGFETMPHNKGGEGALFVKLKNKNKYVYLK